MYDAILFDADDTLFDFAASERRAIERTLAEIGISEAGAPEQYSRINAACWLDFEKGVITQEELRVRRFRELLKMYSAAGDPDEISAIYINNLAEQSILLPGALEAVSAIVGKRPLALVTNGIASVQHRRYEASPLFGMFDAVVISEEVGKPKPAPEMFLAALRGMGLSRQDRALMVGDSLTSDVKGALNAGLRICWYNPGRAPKPAKTRIDHIVYSLGEIPAIALS